MLQNHSFGVTPGHWSTLFIHQEGPPPHALLQQKQNKTKQPTPSLMSSPPGTAICAVLHNWLIAFWLFYLINICSIRNIHHLRQHTRIPDQCSILLEMGCLVSLSKLARQLATPVVADKGPILTAFLPFQNPRSAVVLDHLMGLTLKTVYSQSYPFTNFCSVLSFCMNYQHGLQEKVFRLFGNELSVFISPKFKTCINM